MNHGVRIMRFAFAIALLVASRAGNAQSRLPSRLSDADFWVLSQTLSEPDGFFQSENYVSNELQMQFVIPRFASISPMARSVYLGVGPEQNYTYIAAIRPQIAFLLDIRRGNLLEHLLYKAIFELSEDRADFLSHLFSKPRPANLARHSSIDTIAGKFWDVFGDSVLLRKNREAIFDVLLRRHSLPLSTADTLQLSTIIQMFYRAGLGIHYSFPRTNTRNDATFFDIVVAADSIGGQRGFLASDSAFRFVKDLHGRNMIVPVVGDFAGPKALRDIGRWVRERGATIGAFYVSNVEQYLFQNDRWRPFYANVETLPIDSTSVFVRSLPNMTYNVLYRGSSISIARCDTTLNVVDRRGCVDVRGLYVQDTRPGFRSVTSNIERFIMGLRGGLVMEYFDLARVSR